ncbi:MAG: hypothetical protein Alpg2KO_15180 [Alphaproteobacteria bacterium]
MIMSNPSIKSLLQLNWFLIMGCWLIAVCLIPLAELAALLVPASAPDPNPIVQLFSSEPPWKIYTRLILVYVAYIVLCRILVVYPLTLLLCKPDLGFMNAVVMVLKRLPQAFLMLFFSAVIAGVFLLPMLFLQGMGEQFTSDLGGWLWSAFLMFLVAVLTATGSAMVVMAAPIMWLRQQGPIDAVGTSVSFAVRHFKKLWLWCFAGVFASVLLVLPTQILLAIVLPDNLAGALVKGMDQATGTLIFYSIIPALFWPLFKDMGGQDDQQQTITSPELDSVYDDDDGLHGRW